MFAKIEKDTQGNITHAYYVFDKDADPNLFPGVIVNDGIVDNLIKDNSATILTNYYYDNTTGFVDPKPATPATIDKTTITADNTDTATISNIPTDCKVIVNGTTYTVTDGVFEITSASPGTIKIDFDLFPYLPKTFEVTAG